MDRLCRPSECVLLEIERQIRISSATQGKKRLRDRYLLGSKLVACIWYVMLQYVINRKDR